MAAQHDRPRRGWHARRGTGGASTPRVLIAGLAFGAVVGLVAAPPPQPPTASLSAHVPKGTGPACPPATHPPGVARGELYRSVQARCPVVQPARPGQVRLWSA